MEEIEETTVHWLSGVRVGVGNIWDRDYTLPDGSPRYGPTAEVFILLYDQNPAIVVGVGSEIAVGGERWRVVRVEPAQGRELGSITLARGDETGRLPG